MKDYHKRTKKFDKKISINHTQHLENKKQNNGITFFLTEKETKYYENWKDSLWESMKINDKEDIYVFYPVFQFSPFELGINIKVIIGENELLIRSAFEDDEVKISKFINK